MLKLNYDNKTFFQDSGDLSGDDNYRADNNRFACKIGKLCYIRFTAKKIGLSRLKSGQVSPI